jgi:type II secretory pathway pseudopilin PulG
VLARTLKNTKGALDLSTIMVGVLVIGVIGTLIAAFVLAVIPWTQDQAAKAQLKSVITAQEAFIGMSTAKYGDSLGALVPARAAPTANQPVYGSLKQLSDDGYLAIEVDPKDPRLSVDGSLCVVSSGSVFRAEIRSPTNRLFYVDGSVDVKSLAPEDTVCFPKPPTSKPVVAAPSPTPTPGSGVLDESTTNPEPSPPTPVVTPDVEVLPVTYYYTDGPYWTEVSTPQGVKTAVLIIDDLEVKTDEKNLSDWEIRLDRTKAPYDSIPGQNVQVLSGLPSWASVKSDSKYITIYNNTKSSRIKLGTSQTFGSLRFNYTPPVYPASEMNNTGPNNIQGAGKNILQADTTVSVKNALEGRYGYWETDINVSAMSNELGQNGQATLNPAWERQGFSLTQKTNTVYTLKYLPANDHAFMLKGKDASHHNLTPVHTFGSLLRFTGDGKVNATLTPGGVSGSQWYATQNFSISTPKVGSWSQEINLKELRDLNRSKTPKVNHGSFTLVPKSGDTSGNIWVLSFNDSYQINSVTIQL